MDNDIFFIETRIKGIREELKMIEQALDRLKNKKNTYLLPEELLTETFEEIEVETKGFVPVRWRKKGSIEWKDCVYPKE